MNKSNQSGGAMIVLRVIGVLIAGAAIAYFATGGFDTSEGEPVGATTAAEVDSAPAVIVAKSAPAAPTPASKPLSERYPADAALIYERSTITDAFKIGSGRMLKYMIVLEVDGSVETVAQSLVDYYKTPGAKVTQTPLNEKGVGQAVVSKDGYGLIMVYLAGGKPGTTGITYDVHQQLGDR